MAKNDNIDRRTPVRTISSVMRGQPAPRYQPNRRTSTTAEAIRNRVPPVKGISSGYNRGNAPLTSVTGNAPVRPITSGSAKAPVAPITSTIRQPVAPVVRQPIAPITTTPKAPVSTVTKAPVAPITSPTKAPVNPITSPGSVKPAVSKPTTPAKSSNPLTSVLGKTLLGGGAGALIGSLFKSPTTGKTVTGGGTPTGGKSPTGGSGLKPSTGGTSVAPTKPPEQQDETSPADTQDWRVDNEGRVFDNDGVYMGTMDKDGNLTPAADLTETGSNETFIPTPDDKVDLSELDKLGVGNEESVVTSPLDSIASIDEIPQLNDDSIDQTIYTDPRYASANPNAIAFTDQSGNQYNAKGDLVKESGSDTSTTGSTAYARGLNPANNPSATTDTSTTDDSTTAQYFTDAKGNVYDGSGNLVAIMGSDGQYTSPDDWQEETIADNIWTDPYSGDVWALGDDGYWNNTADTSMYDTNSYATNDYPDFTDYDSSDTQFAKNGGFITMMNKGGLAHFAGGGGIVGDIVPNGDGDYTVTYADGSTETYDSTDSLIGSTPPTNDVASQWTSQGFRDNGNGTFTFTDPEDGSTGTVDADGNAISSTDAQGNVTGGVDSTGQYRSYSNAFQNNPLTPNINAGNNANKGFLNSIKDFVGNNPALSGGAAGALIGSLLSQAGGSNAAPRAPVDISAATAIAPRTTDFGPGMTGGRTGTGSVIVPYEEYAQSDYGMEPDENLYADLGVSGYLGQDQPEDQPRMASGGSTHYTFGRVIDPAENLGLGNGMKKGGLSQAHTLHSHQTNPMVDDRIDFRQGSAVNGAGDGQSDDIPAMLADGEYVMDAELVSMLGNGSNKAGAKILDKFREEIRQHKRSAPLNKIPPKSKSTLDYLRIAQKVK